MQPFQSASAATRKSGETPLNLAKYLGGAAIGGVGSAATAKLTSNLMSRVGAFLSPYISEEIFSKGLEKVDPRFGKFIKGALDQGFDHEEIRNFIGEKVKKEQDSKAPDSKGIVERHSPELHQFIMGEIQSGRSPIEAAALASLDRKGKKGFKSAIDKLVKDHKAPFASIVESVYGSAQQPKRPDAQQESSQGVDPEFEKIIQGGAALLKKFRGQ